ncbi:MAG: hypothetical protein ACTSRP_07635 [Candidatus Helarchaeota archaeon]
MFSFYHFYPTCPCCHEPHRNYNHLIKEPTDIGEELIYCTNCKVKFKPKIDLHNPNDFSNTIKYFISNFGHDQKKYLESLPLIWKINLNCIEESYINWIKKIPSKNILITWPWSKVKFLPVLALTYLSIFPNNKILLIGDYESDSLTSKTDRLNIDYPKLWEIFNYIIYSEISIKNLDNIEQDIKNEIRKLNKPYLLKKIKVIHYNIKNLKNTRIIENGKYYGTAKKCINLISEELKHLYGENCIRTIIIITKNIYGNTIRKTMNKNKNGFIDLILNVEDQWGNKIRYKNEWLWEILLNLDKVKRMIKKFKIIKYDKNGLNDKCNILIVPNNTSEDIIFDYIINKFMPDLIIFKDIDEIFVEVHYNKNRRKKFFEFLRNNKNVPTLLFSTNKSLRYQYQWIYQNENYLENYNMTFHTWDIPNLKCYIEEIDNELLKKESYFMNPLSSKWNETETEEINHKSSIEYIEVEDLDKLDNIFEFIKYNKRDKDIINNIKRFVFHIKTTPLLIWGETQNYEVFKRKNNLTYDTIMSNIVEILQDYELYKNFNNLLKEIYEKDTNTSINPIMEKIKDLVKDLLINPQNVISIIVHPSDVKGTKKLLKEQNLYNKFDNKLDVCTWKTLGFRENIVGKDEKHYVISTFPLFHEYNIYSSKIKKFYFIGSKNNLEKFKILIEKRLNEIFTKPIFLLSDIDLGPPLLSKILKKIDPETLNAFYSYISPIVIDYSDMISNMKDDVYNQVSSTHSQPRIISGENAILLVDRNNSGIFIPEESSIFVISSNELEEIHIKKRDSNISLQQNLKNKKILLNKSGIYFSFRPIFIHFMINYGKNIIFKKGIYKWNGFINLLNDAYEWISIIKKAIKLYSEKNNIDYKESEIIIADYLSKLGLSAKNPDYIRSWWSDYDKIKISDDEEYFIYKIEHPKSRDDIFKIYEGLNNLISELNINVNEADKTWFASYLIQSFRRNILKRDFPHYDPELIKLYKLIKKDIMDIINKAESFNVESIYKVSIKNDVESFRKYDDFDRFISKILF